MNKLAQIPLYDTGGSNAGMGLRGFGLFGLETTTSNSAGSIFTVFISRAIGVITVVAFIWFLFVLITGAMAIIASGGDKQALEGAKKKITTGLIGVVAIVSGIFIARLVGAFLGIENFLNPTVLIDRLSP